MSDFGFWELALVMLIALLVVGPERLPRLAASIGQWLGRARHMANQFKTELMHDADLGDARKILDDTRKTLTETGASIQREINDSDPLVRAIEDQVASGRLEPDTTPDEEDAAEHPALEPDEKDEEEARRDPRD